MKTIKAKINNKEEQKNNIPTITPEQLNFDYTNKKNVIINSYADIYAYISELEEKLRTCKLDNKQIGMLKAEISLMNLKKKAFENTYFNY